MYTQEQILDMYFRREQEAVNATSQMYGAKLTRFADGMVCHEDALECVNDTYIAAWHKIPPERPMRFLSWLYRVCRNIVCDRIDWNNASKRNSNLNCMLDELEECLADSNAKYEGEMSDIGRCLSDFLNGLDREKRVLFVRRYWYGMTIDELETKTSNVISQGNAQNNVYAGIKSGNELGDYVVAANYEQLYDSVKKVEDSMKEARSGDWVDGPETSGAMTDYTTSSNSDKETTMDTAQDSASASGTEYSTTNVMTEGVDESDVVKTDGKYIYMVEDGQISITDISKGEPADETLFRPEFEVPSDTIEELFVSDGKMLIISNHAGDKDETICYSYDVADPTKPALIGKARQDGYYNTSRKIGNTVYVFSDTYIRTSDMEKNVALQEDNLEKWVPQVNGRVISYDCFYIDDDTYSGTVISSFDVSTPDKTIDAKCIMNDNGEVYVSGDAMYLYHSDWSASREHTKISKISFEDGVMKTGETTSVNGYLNDKFAISQQGEYLHMWDDTHVLGIGYGDSQQSKIKLTMFDVSDPTKPVEVSQKLIDNRDNWGNEFVYNYKAILADPKKNLIGFATDDYYLFSYDNENGFNLVEQQALTYKNSGGYRGIYKDNDFYVAGNGEIKYFKLAE